MNPNFFLLRTALKDSLQGPPTANRQPPTAGHCSILFLCDFCGPCLDYQAESVPVNVRFCWRYVLSGAHVSISRNGGLPDEFFFLQHMANVQRSVSEIRKGKPIIRL